MISEPWVPLPAEQITDMADQYDLDKYSEVIDFARSIEQMTRLRAGLKSEHE